MIFKYVITFSPLLPLLFGYKKLKNPLWWVAFFGFLSDLITTFILLPIYLENNQNDYRHYIGNSLFIILFLIISYYYFKKIKPANTSLIIFASLGVFQTLFFTYNSIVIDKFNAPLGSIFFIFYFVYAIAGFYKILKEQAIENLSLSEFFWANIAIITYGAGFFAIFLFSNHLKEIDKELLKIYWQYIVWSVNIIFNILLAITLTRKQP